jgi:hypothetical protein
MEVQLINLTPAPIYLAAEAIPPSGIVATVEMKSKTYQKDKLNYNDVTIVEVNFSGITGLPDPDRDVRYIVSPDVLPYIKSELNRLDCCAPDYGPTARRILDGSIFAITQFII